MGARGTPSRRSWSGKKGAVWSLRRRERDGETAIMTVRSAEDA
jgi:hypothetical protein